MSKEPALILAMALIATTTACNSKGTCVLDEGKAQYTNAPGRTSSEMDTDSCLVNYAKSACLETRKPQGVFEAVTGEAGVASCRGRGFTVAKTRDSFIMSQPLIDAALKKGESVTFYRPSKFDRR